MKHGRRLIPMLFACMFLLFAGVACSGDQYVNNSLNYTLNEGSDYTTITFKVKINSKGVQNIFYTVELKNAGGSVMERRELESAGWKKGRKEPYEISEFLDELPKGVKSIEVTDVRFQNNTEWLYALGFGLFAAAALGFYIYAVIGDRRGKNPPPAVS